jgi:hypothetical protein
MVNMRRIGVLLHEQREMAETEGYFGQAPPPVRAVICGSPIRDYPSAEMIAHLKYSDFYDIENDAW